MTRPLVFGIVLAWNHVDDTLETIESLLNSDYSCLNLVLVDNASTDQTIEEVGRRFPKVKILASIINLGVSGGYNLGMEYALSQGAEYILIANNDIKVDGCMVSRMVNEMEERKESGMIMPKIYLYDDPTRLWMTGAHWRFFPPALKMEGLWSKDGPQFSSSKKIDFAPSCVLLLKSEAIKRVGYFDTGYFFYFDDWDYSIRFRNAGYEIWFSPMAKMLHKVSKSTLKSAKPSQWWVYQGRSTARFYLKHKSKLHLRIYGIWFTLREFVKGNGSCISLFWQGVKLQVKLEAGEKA